MAQEMVPYEDIGKKRSDKHCGGLRQKYVLDERGRRLMLDLYDGTSEKITQLERLLGVPRGIVKNWGSQLGLTRQKDPRWTEEDIAYLQKHLHHYSLDQIAKHLRRTKVAVRLKAKRIGVNKCYQEGYTMRGLCMALGCDHHKVERWIAAGWLVGTRRKTERQDDRDVWLFTDEQIRRFLWMHPLEVDSRRFDWLFIHSLLTGVGELTNDGIKRGPK